VESLNFRLNGLHTCIESDKEEDEEFSSGTAAVPSRDRTLSLSQGEAGCRAYSSGFRV